MFSAFNRTIPQLSIFHNTQSSSSKEALRLLQNALTVAQQNKAPLKFNLEVINDQPPTSDQLRTIQSYIKPSSPASPSPSIFISSHPTSDVQPNTIDDVVKLAKSNPNALKWPIVVDWDAGKAVVGNLQGVKSMLEEMRKEQTE
ncbi:hypothetical protein QCA50_010605 [Cerrena zonata]|uniref:Thioredoxin-like protein n=1 Tax=Cerrena zonata TaxID=2478898 RepID=A0AAW0G027_9APHY